MGNKVKKMNISVMREILQDMNYDGERSFMMNEDFGISYQANTFFKTVLSRNKWAPFLVEDYRIGYIVKGEITATVNLIDHHVTEGHIVFIGRGTVAQIHDVSQDLCVRGFIISQNLMNKVFSNQQPDIINGTVLAQVFDTNAEDIEFLNDINQAAWHLLQHKNYNDKVLCGMLSSLLYYIDDKYHETLTNTSGLESSNRNHEIFNRFISLVNQYAAQERSIGFYADKMCLSPRYLSTVVGQHSGQTCKEWIDQATINHAKVMLVHTEKSISQIADALKFPNDSFFCKYFRRLTGVSPTEYRNS